MINVLVIDDHEIMGEAVAMLLADDPEIRVLGAAATAADGLRRARTEQPDIVIMDGAVPDTNGGATARILSQLCPTVKVITLTAAERQSAYRAAADGGGSASMCKTQASLDLRLAVHSVSRCKPSLDGELLTPPLEDLVVHYQPIIDLTTNRTVGFEALVRWQHPGRGLIQPAEFLPRAEETGSIYEMSKQVGDIACGQLVTWQKHLAAAEELWVSLNVPASGVKRPGFADDIADVIAASGVRAPDVVIEVTESVLMEDAKRALFQLNRLKELGVRLALDDFGSGYSSLSYLRQFPFDLVKIDTSFTAELPQSSRSRILAEAIHQLASALGMRGIAEGVERPEQAHALKDIGWEFAQGFLYSKPVEAAAAEMLCLGAHAHR